jgi:hypothetical protein
MHRKDYVILAVLIVVAILSVYVITNVVEASWVVLAAGEAGEPGVESAYPWPDPYPMYDSGRAKLLPIIFHSGN